MKSEKLSSGLKSLKSLASMKNTITVLHHLLIISTCTGSNQGLEITALVFNTDRANMNTDKYLGIGRMYPVTSYTCQRQRQLPRQRFREPLPFAAAKANGKNGKNRG